MGATPVTIVNMNNVPVDGSNPLPVSLNFYETVNAQTGTTYTILATDWGKLVTTSNGSSIAVTLPQANSTTFAAGFWFDFVNKGVGTATITPTTSTIGGAATLAFGTGEGARIVSDGTDYQVQGGTPAVDTTVVRTTGTQTVGGVKTFSSAPVIATITGPTAITGIVNVASATATPAGGSSAAKLLFGTTALFGIYYGSGAPSSLTAAKGSLYLRSDGSGVADRAYINTDGSTTWTAIATAG